MFRLLFNHQIYKAKLCSKPARRFFSPSFKSLNDEPHRQTFSLEVQPDLNSSTNLTPDNKPDLSNSSTNLTPDNQPDIPNSSTTLTPDNKLDLSNSSNTLTPDNQPDISSSSTNLTPDNQPDISSSSTNLTPDSKPDISSSSTTLTPDSNPDISNSLDLNSPNYRQLQKANGLHDIEKTIIPGKLASTVSEIKPKNPDYKPFNSPTTRMNSMIKNRDREQIWLSQISRIRDIYTLSAFITEKVFIDHTDIKKSEFDLKSDPNITTDGKKSEFDLKSDPNITTDIKKIKQSTDKDLLLGQKRLELKMVLSSPILTNIVALARSMGSMELVMYIYDRTNKLPTQTKLTCFEAGLYLEFIKSAWELDHNIDFVIKLMNQSIVFGAEFDSVYIEYINEILAKIRDKPQISNEFKALKKLAHQAQSLIV
ncbi:hypothetical protein BB561_000703 [Smittium simulii]|uniref:Mtf2-like C-terminal domain-containing protein n=1 Tax=Smittium simulii TaxID=133385 RepID=A0A2T9YXX6_9FUNG|nr:hypothetical protein BB561_000703 [Smittium simulii]